MGTRTNKNDLVAKRLTAFWAIATVVLGLAAVSLIGFYRQSNPTVQDAIPVRISMSGFTPREIRVKAGQPIRIELINMDGPGHADGGGWHNFVVERFGVNVKVAPKQRQVFTFTPTEPGVYDFYCDMCCGGKENPFMHGRLIVS